MQIKKNEFNIAFLSRTKQIVNDAFLKNITEYEVTLLLNCCLALICLPLEKLNSFNVEDSLGEELFKGEIYAPSYPDGDPGGTDDMNNYNAVLRALRNGIAHLGITILNDSNSKKIKGVIIIGSYTFSRAGSRHKDYVVEYTFKFSVNQLRDFVILMADTYLKELLK